MKERGIGRDRKDKVIEKMATAGVGAGDDGEDVWEEIELWEILDCGNFFLIVWGGVIWRF